MIKKFTAFILCVILALSLCACGDDNSQITDPTTDSTIEGTTTADNTEANTPAQTTETPEEITKDFLIAMYTGDFDRFVNHIPDFACDILLNISGGEIVVNEGETTRDAIENYLKEASAEGGDKMITEPTIETKISDTLTKDDYIEALNTYYIPEGLITEADLDAIEDAVYVSFNCKGTYENGEELVLDNFDQSVPCVKIEGKWYVDFVYLMMIPVQSTVEQVEIEG